MTTTRTKSDECMRIAVQAYVGLLCAGERVLSKELLRTSIDLAAALRRPCVSSAGDRGGGRGPRIALAAQEPERDDCPLSRRRLTLQLALRNLLTTLLLLRVTAYWRRVPLLEQLHLFCIAIAEETDPPPGTWRTARLRSADLKLVSQN